MVLASDAAWRVVLLLLEALAPWAPRWEVVGASSAAIAWSRLAAALAVYLLATWGIRRATSRYPGVAALGVVTLLAAPVMSVLCTGDQGPLARGCG